MNHTANHTTNHTANHTANLTMTRYILAKQNYINLSTSRFQKGGDVKLFDRLLENYVYQRGLNDNEGHRDIIIDGKKYSSTIYGEVFTEDVDGLNSLKLFINIAKHKDVDFFGDLGSGRGMLSAALNDGKGINKTYAIEIVSKRHDEAVKFMKNVLNVDNSWNVETSRLAEAIGHAIIPDNVNDPSEYLNRVVFTHKENGKVLEYLNGDMLYVDFTYLLDGYNKPMFWISNLCFPEITLLLFDKFKDTLPVGTIVILSRPPTDVEQYGFSKMHNPELGINNGRLILPQTWNTKDYVECLEFAGMGSTVMNRSII